MSSVAKNISLVSPCAAAGVWQQAAAPRIAETLSKKKKKGLRESVLLTLI